MYILKQIKPTRHNFKCRKCNEMGSAVVNSRDVIAGSVYLTCGNPECQCTNIVKAKLNERTVESSEKYHDLVDRLNALSAKGGAYVIEAV